jgi:hypothetical protein
MAIIKTNFITQLKTKYNIYILKLVMSFLGIQMLLRKKLLLAKISSMHFCMKLIIILGQSHLIDHFLMESIIGKLLLMLEQNMN